MAAAEDFKKARDKYGVSLDEIKWGMQRSGRDDPAFGALYSMADCLALNVRGGVVARHYWNMEWAKARHSSCIDS